MLTGRDRFFGAAFFVAPQAQGMVSCSELLLAQLGAIVSLMHGHKIWRKQCQATRTIRRRFGLKNALDYLVSEKLLNFAEVAEQHPEFAAELPRFQAAVWEVFHPYELAGYLASLRPMTRKKLQKLLYVRGAARGAG
jgi:hypothetical protein